MFGVVISCVKKRNSLKCFGVNEETSFTRRKQVLRDKSCFFIHLPVIRSKQFLYSSSGRSFNDSMTFDVLVIRYYSFKNLLTFHLLPGDLHYFSVSNVEIGRPTM